MNIGEISRRRRLSWGAALVLRLLVCVVMLLAHLVTDHWAPVWAMAILAAHSLRSISVRSNLTMAVSLLVLLHAAWTLVLVSTTVFELLPVMGTPNRWGVFTATNLASGVLGASQLLFLLTLALERVPEGADFTFSSSRRVVWPLFLLVIVVSFAINGTSFIGHGGYAGNVNSYWSGLPAVFVVIVAACYIRAAGSVSLWVFMNLVVAYWVLTGNRSEVLMLFVFGNVCFLSTRALSASEGARRLAALGVVVAGFVIFSVIGLVRVSGFEDSSSSLVRSVFSEVVQGDRLNVSTVGSSVYSGLVAIDISKSDRVYYGETYVGQIKNIVPSFIPTPWRRYSDPYEVYQGRYQTMGGFGLLGESFLNFGMLGPVMLGALMTCFLRLLILWAPRSKFCSWFLLSFALYSTRYFFYGYVYLHNLTVLFLLIGAMLVLGRMALKSEKLWV